MCAWRSRLIPSFVHVCSGVWSLVLLPNLPFLTCPSMSTLESVTYLPEKGLYCQRLPSSRTHGGTESLKGKNTDNMGFYGTLKMIFYKVSSLGFLFPYMCKCMCIYVMRMEKSVSSEMAAVSHPHLFLVASWMLNILYAE